MNKKLKVKILKLLCSSAFTIDSIASKLGIDRRMVKEVIDYLVIRGYVTEMEIGPDCKNRCTTCNIRGLCPFSGINLTTKIKIYVITRRGNEYIRKHA